MMLTRCSSFSAERYSSSFLSNKIRGFIADLELFLQMCGRQVHHWGFILLASLGIIETEKVPR